MSRRRQIAWLVWVTGGAGLGFGACNPSTVFFDPTGKTCTAGGTDCPDGWSCIPSPDSADYVCWPSEDAGEPSGEPDSGLVFMTDGGRDGGVDAGRDAGGGGGDAGKEDAGVDGGGNGDAGRGDAGVDGGGGGDAGKEDAGSDGGGGRDAGEPDAGSGGDAGKQDAGVDGGTAVPDAGPHCTIGTQTEAPGTLNPGNACQSCQPANSPTGWSDLADGTGCGGTQLCSAGVCSDVCEIGGSIVTANAINASNSCQLCLPGQSNSGWSEEPDGFSCSGGTMICVSGTCASDCYIGGSVIAAATVNTMNTCQTCQPTSSTTGWTNLVDGTSCASAGSARQASAAASATSGE